jgi:glycosyltransferase involved in cell wall biosynthesis
MGSSVFVTNPGDKLLPILFIDQFGTFGGGQKVLWIVLQSLVPTKYRPLVALHGDGSFRKTLVASGYQVMDLAIGNYQSGQKPIRDALRFLWRTALCALQLAVCIIRRDIKLLYANGPRTFVCASIAGKLTHRPVIWHLHNVLASRLELRLLTIFGNWAHQILACSRAVAQRLQTARPDLCSKITVIHNPTPRWTGLPPSHEVRKDPDHVGIGILGRITPFKGQLQFAQAAQLVIQEIPQVHFWIIGSPAAGDHQDQRYFERIQIFVKDAKLERQFSFVGHQTDVRPYYEVLDIVVVASQGPEAFGMTVLEAMSLAKAVVAPRVGGIDELVEDETTALLVTEATPESLAGKILDLLSDSDKRRRLGENAREVAQARFSADVFEQKVQQILTSALKPVK